MEKFDFLDEYAQLKEFRILTFIFKYWKQNLNSSQLDQIEKKYSISLVIIWAAILGISMIWYWLVMTIYTISIESIGLAWNVVILFIFLVLVVVPILAVYTQNIDLSAFMLCFGWILLHAQACSNQPHFIPAYEIAILPLSSIVYLLTKNFSIVFILQSILLSLSYFHYTQFNSLLISVLPADMSNELSIVVLTGNQHNYLIIVLMHIFQLTIWRLLEGNFINYQYLIKNLIIQTQESEKAKYLMVASMSHEFRNPLNSILVSMEVLSSSLIGVITPQQNDILQIVISCCEVLRSLVNNILDVGKLKASEGLEIAHKPFDIRKLVTKIININQCAAKYKNISLGFRAHQNLPRMILNDPDRVWQILINLVSNSMKFTHEGYVHIFLKYEPDRRSIDMRHINEPHQTIELPHGVYNQLDINPQEENEDENNLDVSMTTPPGTQTGFSISFGYVVGEKITQATQTFSANEGSPDPATSTQHQETAYWYYSHETKGNLIIDIVDTGSGIAEEELQHLWKSFQHGQTQSYESTGLGLFISKMLIEKLNGEILVKSTVGEGSTFTISIPIDISPEQNEQDFPMHDISISDELLTAVSGSKIAITEDIYYNQMAMKELVQSLGCHVAMCHNGSDMVAFYEQYHEQLTAILMDIYMPKMNGIDTTKAIRAFEQRHGIRQIPIFIVTVDPKSEKKAKEAGANEYFVKPLLQARLAKVLAVYQKNIYTVLIVDQDRFALEMMREMLTLEGFKSVQTRSPHEVDEKLKNEKIDMVIVDQALEGIGGIGMAKIIKRLGYKIPILITTEFFSQQFKAHCMSKGISDVLQKPISRQMLTDRIRSTMSRALS